MHVPAFLSLFQIAKKKSAQLEYLFFTVEYLQRIRHKQFAYLFQ